MSEFENGKQPVAQYDSVFDRMRDDDGSVKSGLAIAVVSATAGGLIVGAVLLRSGEAGQAIVEEATEIKGTYTEKYAVDLECKERSTLQVGLETRSKLELPGYAKRILPDTVAGSGFNVAIRDETGREGTMGTYDQLTCIEGSGLEVTSDMDAMTRTATINMDGMRLFTRKAADKTTVVYDSPLLSSMGELGSKALNVITFGYFKKTENYIEETKAKIGAVAEQMAENHAEQVCATSAIEATKKIVEISLIETAEQEGYAMSPTDITWLGKNPAFKGPYELDGQDDTFKIESQDFSVSECEVDPDLEREISALHATKISDIKSDRQAEAARRMQGEQ